MLWVRYRMVFFSCRIYMPSDVVLRYGSIFRKLLPQGSKGARWPSRFRNCCTGMYSCIVRHSHCLSSLAEPKSARPLAGAVRLLVAKSLRQHDRKIRKRVGYVLQSYSLWYKDTVEYSEIVYIYIYTYRTYKSGFFSTFKW